MRFPLLVVAAILGVAPASLSGQHATTVTAPHAVQGPSVPAPLQGKAMGTATEPSFGRVLLGATLGGTVVPVVAGAVGHVLAPGDPSGYVSPGMATGVMLGLAVGPAIGAHMTNERQGNPVLAALGATAGTALLTFAVRQANPEPGAFIILIPVTQIGLSALFEYVTER